MFSLIESSLNLWTDESLPDHIFKLKREKNQVCNWGLGSENAPFYEVKWFSWKEMESSHGLQLKSSSNAYLKLTKNGIRKMLKFENFKRLMPVHTVLLLWQVQIPHSVPIKLSCDTCPPVLLWLFIHKVIVNPSLSYG